MKDNRCATSHICEWKDKSDSKVRGEEKNCGLIQKQRRQNFRSTVDTALLLEPGEIHCTTYLHSLSLPLPRPLGANLRLRWEVFVGSKWASSLPVFFARKKGVFFALESWISYSHLRFFFLLCQITPRALGVCVSLALALDHFPRSFFLWQGACCVGAKLFFSLPAKKETKERGGGAASTLRIRQQAELLLSLEEGEATNREMIYNFIRFKSCPWVTALLWSFEKMHFKILSHKN